MTIKDRKLIALIVGVVYIVFLVFVFLLPELRTDKFVRGITGLLTAVFIVIELFILVPPPANKVPTALAIRVPVAVASSAVFFYFLLPQILPFIFPDDDTKTVSGTVYSKGKNERLNDALISIPGTQLTTPTNADGAFTVTKVPKDKNKLTIRYGGVEREFDIDKSEKYYFEQIIIEKTTSQKLDSTFWKEEASAACNNYKGNNDAVKLFVLKKDRIPKVQGYDKLYLKVQYLGEGSVVYKDSNEEEMIKVGSEFNPALWSLDAKNDFLKFAVAFCIGIKKNSKPPTVNDWDSSFWFEREK